MARRRRAGYGDLLNLRIAAVALVLAAAALAACGLVPTAGPSVTRDRTTLVINVPGFTARPVQGYLCPEDPGVGPTLDNAGIEAIARTGCLDLGRDDSAAGGGLTVRLNLESLASAQLEAFANRPGYRLLLISGTDPRTVFAADVPAVSLVP